MLLKTLRNEKGFSLIEILIGATVFSLGMLGIIALQLSSIKSTRFASNMGLGMSLASSQIEELMLVPYNDALLNDDDNSSVGQDPDDNGFDDTGVDAVDNFGLDRNCHTSVDPTCTANADGVRELGDDFYNGKYVLYWNVAVDEPITDTKTINMIISWRVKESEGGQQQVSFTTVRARAQDI